MLLIREKAKFILFLAVIFYCDNGASFVATVMLRRLALLWLAAKVLWRSLFLPSEHTRWSPHSGKTIGTVKVCQFTDHDLHIIFDLTDQYRSVMRRKLQILKMIADRWIMKLQWFTDLQRGYRAVQPALRQETNLRSIFVHFVTFNQFPMAKCIATR